MKRNPRKASGYGSSAPNRQAELKSMDIAVNATADSTGFLLLLNGMVQGTDFDERVGRQIYIKSVEMRVFDSVTAATGIDQAHRFLIVRDKQANGVAPAILDVLTSVTTIGLYNLNNRHRFVIEADFVQMLNASAEPLSQIVHDKLVNIGALTTYNSGVAGTVADINTNSLYLIVIGSVAAGATAGSAAGISRLRYYDL